MKTKTINKVVRKKLNEWLDTITVVSLRNKVRDNLLLSGGAIASMLLKDPVNDYDVYIQDQEVLLELANYYCGGLVLDGRKRDFYLKDRFPEVYANDGYYTDGHNLSGEKVKYVAEEYVRLSNLKPDQVKLDIPGTGVKKEPKKDTTYSVSFLSQNAISLTDDIQIVLRFSGTPEQIHKTFDFIHATNYFTFKDGLILNNAALTSLITRSLEYQGSLYPLTSIIRMKKFIKRNWTITAGEILKIMFQISELDLRDIEVLEEQLIGVDVAYFGMLIEAMRATPKNEITSDFINDMIDKVFNQYDDESDEVMDFSNPE